MNKEQHLHPDDKRLIQLVSKVINDERQQPVDPDMAETIMEKIRHSDIPETISLPKRILYFSAAAAGFLLIILAGNILGNLYTDTLSDTREIIRIHDADIEQIDFIVRE